MLLPESRLSLEWFCNYKQAKVVILNPTASGDPVTSSRNLTSSAKQDSGGSLVRPRSDFTTIGHLGKVSFHVKTSVPKPGRPWLQRIEISHRALPKVARVALDAL